jgi:chromosome segregation ATPase
VPRPARALEALAVLRLELQGELEGLEERRPEVERELEGLGKDIESKRRMLELVEATEEELATQGRGGLIYILYIRIVEVCVYTDIDDSPV